MPYSRTLYLLATLLFGIVTGIGHLAAELFSPRSAEAIALSATMQNTMINLAGTELSIYTLNFGISILMGLMLIAYGLINLLVLRETPNGQLPSRSLQLANIAVTVMALVLALKYLFIVPVALIGLAAGLFLMVLLTNISTNKIRTVS